MNGTGFTARERVSVLSLSGVFVLRMLGIFIVLPVLSPYAISFFGPDHVNELLVGLVMGAFPLGQTLMQVPAGWMSDRIGRKPIIVCGLILFGGGSLIAGFTGNIWLLILGLFVQGIGAIGSSILALTADLTRPDVRTRAMAIIGGGIGIAFGIGMIGGSFFESLFGARSLFFVMALLAVAGIVLMLFVVPTPDRREHHEEVQFSVSRLKRILSDGGLWTLNGGIFVLNGSLRGLFVSLPLLLGDLLASSNVHWVYLSVLTVSGLTAFPLIFLAESKGYLRQTLIFGFVVLGCGLAFAVPGQRSLYRIILVMVLYFIGFSLLEALLPSMVSQHVSRSSRGTAMGLFNMSQYFGSFCGGLLGGLALKFTHGQDVMFALVVVLVVLVGYPISRFELTENSNG